MKETKLKRLIKKMMDSIFLDAMTPEFKAANAELLKAIKMNDKSGAVPHADLEAVNKAMKENDADKAGAALKKVQLQFSKAEKKLDEDVKSIQAKLETTKKAAETAKASLKQKKALAPVFDKLKTLVSWLSNNPKNASKLTALTDKVKDYGDLSKRASQIITLVSSNKDASKQIDMLKRSVDSAEKKYKKDLANVEKESKKADDALEVAKMQVKITQGKRDAFTKERLYIANVVKQMPEGRLSLGGKNNEQQVMKLQSEVESIVNKEYDDLYKTKEELDESLKKASSFSHGHNAPRKIAELLNKAYWREWKRIDGGKNRPFKEYSNEQMKYLQKIRRLEKMATGSLDDLSDEIKKEQSDPYMKKAIQPVILFINKFYSQKDDLTHKTFNGHSYDFANKIYFIPGETKLGSIANNMGKDTIKKIQDLFKRMYGKEWSIAILKYLHEGVFSPVD